MSNMEINALLAQMRATASRLEQSLPAGSGVQETAAGEFKSLLKDSINSVNETQQTAVAMAESFEKGDPDAHLTEVMLQLQKADLSFRAMTEVRNKLVNAYQEIMNMPV
ncbi:MAG: flagellar hook-basal body complex protein FliE [Gammaproteobacteria bacterium]|nr:flagellar hook-basal body complex protein FliE [Gammaproteobacteria bacterium]